MKTIKRIISGVVDKSIYLLVGKKNFTPTLVPDDWPPDGSMHFLRFDHPIGSAGLPPNAVQYEFAANVGEDDPIVFALGQEIIFRLCNPHKTLIVFTVASELSNHKKQKISTPSTEIVAQFLHSTVPKTSVIQKENMVSFLTLGYPKKLFSQYQAAADMPYCFIDTYLFSEEMMPLSPEEGLL